MYIRSNGNANEVQKAAICKQITEIRYLRAAINKQITEINNQITEIR